MDGAARVDGIASQCVRKTARRHHLDHSRAVIALLFGFGCSESSRLRWANDADLNEDDERRDGFGAQATVLRDRCDAGVRSLVCGLPAEPAQP